MYFVKNIVSILCRILYISTVFCNTGFINHLTDYMVRELGTRGITLLIGSSDKLSARSLSIAQGIVRKVPSLLVNVDLLVTPKPLDQNSVRMMELMSEVYEQRILKVLIIEDNDGSMPDKIQEQLKYNVEFLMKFPNYTSRPKCIIIMVDVKDNSKFLEFLKFSWSEQFLYITIIEIVRSVKYADKFQSSFAVEESDIVIHDYNPFNDSYIIKPLFTSSLFVDKLSDLQGYSLTANFVEEIPTVMMKGNHSQNITLKSIYGIDVLVTDILAKLMNFSLILVSNSYEDLSVLFCNHSVDYVVNIFAETGLPSFKQGQPCTVGSTLLYEYTNHLIVKQYGFYKTDLLSHSSSVFNVVTIFLIIILLSLFPIGHDISVTRNDSAKFRAGFKLNLRRLSAKIFLLCFSLIIITISLKFFEDTWVIFLSKRTYKSMKTLTDVSESGIIPVLTNDITYSVLHNEAIFSKWIHSSEDSLSCIEALVTQNNKVNGCTVNQVLGKFGKTLFFVVVS